MSRQGVASALGRIENLMSVIPDLSPGSGIDEAAIAGTKALIAIVRSLLQGGREPAEIVEVLLRMREDGAATLDVDETVHEWLARQLMNDAVGE